jgi:hypothetical protein
VAYLLEQSRLFAEGRRRDAFMEGLFKALSVDEKVGVACTSRPSRWRRGPLARAELRASGEALYARPASVATLPMGAATRRSPASPGNSRRTWTSRSSATAPAAACARTR